MSVSQAGIDATAASGTPSSRLSRLARRPRRQVFTKAQKERLRDPDYKFHLEQTGDKTFVLSPVKELKVSENAGGEGKQVTVANPYASQPLQFSLRVDGPVNGVAITLPDGSQIKSEAKMEKGQFVICKGEQAYLADKNRKKLADLPMDPPWSCPRANRRSVCNSRARTNRRKRDLI